MVEFLQGEEGWRLESMGEKRRVKLLSNSGSILIVGRATCFPDGWSEKKSRQVAGSSIPDCCTTRAVDAGLRTRHDHPLILVDSPSLTLSIKHEATYLYLGMDML